MRMIDTHAIRSDFPIFERLVHGRPLVYLDSAATSQKPRVVIDALDDYYRRYNANIHRGIYTLAEEATQAYEGTRKKVAEFIGASEAAEVVFTRNTTESINLVAYTWAQQNVHSGDEILLTEMEHHSNLIPWILLAQRSGAVLRYIPFDGEGYLDLDAAQRLISDRTKLVSIVHMSNVLGTINPVARIASWAHAQGAYVHVDAAQSVPHLGVNVDELGCDFLAFSSHKMLGPTGVGVLWARREVLEAMPPFMGGGEMISQVFPDRATWNEIPWKFEAGTPNIADVVAFGAAVDYLMNLGMPLVRAHEVELTEYAIERLAEEPDVHMYGPRDPENKGGVVAFNLADLHSHDVASVVDTDGVCIRVGHHCCQPLMRKLEIPGSARASFYVYNTHEDIDRLVEALDHVRQVFGLARA